MPPKQQKKGDLEDYSDVLTLPKAKVFKFAIIHKKFFAKENRDKIQKIVSASLVPTSGHKVKLLARDEIVTYGTTKGYIMSQEAQNALPAEDPRKLLSEEDMIAKSVSDKLFELTVNVRRERKEKLTKIEAEITALQAAGKDSSHLSLESDTADCMFQFIDYPNTKKEALALSKYGHSLNCIFEIEEVPAEDNEGEPANSDALKKTYFSPEPKKTGPLDDGKETTHAQAVVMALREAKIVCSNKSALRQLAFIQVGFQDRKEIQETTDADGNTHEKVRSPEESFMTQLYSKFIDKYSQYYLQYLKFKDRVTLEPLMPDRVVQDKIRELQREGEYIRQYLDDATHEINDGMSMMEKTKSDATVDDAKQIQANMDEAKASFTKQKEELLKRDAERLKEIKSLQVNAKVSLDDEKDYSKFKIDFYKSDFIDNSETANNISSVLSAMITQIDENSRQPWDMENTQDLKANSIDQETLADSLDDLFEKYENEICCDLKIRDRGLDPVKETSLADTLSSKYIFGGKIQIHEESDRTKEVSHTLPLGLVDKEGDRATLIAEREAEVLSYFNLPGKDRHLMPAIPAKSKRSRNAENPSFYPFCTLPIQDAERMLLLKQLQQLVKSNFIDQGLSAEQRHTKNKVFQRSFENYMTPEIFRQVFNDALLDKPEMASLYYPRTDSLLIALFNRVKAQKDQTQPATLAVSLPDFFLGEDFDGEQKWQAPYRVMPDFQNWLAFFAEEMIIGQEVIVPLEDEKKDEPVAKEAPKGKGKEVKVEKEDESNQPVTVNIIKYSIDDESVPETLLNIEDDKIQSIQEHTASLFPDDNSIMRVEHFTVGGLQFSKSIVFKDNFKFGLRQKDLNQEAEQEDYNSADEDDTENGLVSYKQIGDSEFWLHFENGTKLSVEQVQLKRNPQKTIRIDPPIPTAEEIAAKEEAIKAYQAAVTKAQQKKQPIPSLDDFAIPKTPQPRWETRALSYVDKMFSEDSLEQFQSLGTITLKNGLIVQYLGSGHVMQIQEREAMGLEEDITKEINRIISKEGVVIRQFRNHDAEILFADGVSASFSKKNLEWILTNNLGKRRQFKNGVSQDLESIPCAVETDQSTGAKMMIREDGIVTVSYVDGSVYCHHKDGTKMHTNIDGSEIRVEKKNFASHIIKIGKSSSQPSAKTINHKNVFQRALDDRVIETYLPDGSMSQTFLDKVVSKKGESDSRYRHLIRRSDLSIVLLDSKGHISLISSNTRAAMNEVGFKIRIDSECKDVDYLVELARQPGQFTPSVYQGYISAKEGKSKIKTKNTANNTVFEMTCDHTLHKIKDALVLDSPLKKPRKVGKKSESLVPIKVLGEMELEETDNFEDPFQNFYEYPRFFVINNTGAAKELLSQSQLEYATRCKKIQTDQSIKQKMADVVNNVSLANHYFLTKVINMKQIELEAQKLNDVELPANAADVLEKQVEQPELQLQIPVQEQYLYKQIFQMPGCDMFSQQAFANDYIRFKEWQMQQVRYDTEFAIQHKIGGKDGIDPRALEDDLYFNKRINKHILKHRTQPKQAFNPEEFKYSAIKGMATSGEVQAFRKSQMNKSLNSLKSGSRGGSRGNERQAKISSKLNSDVRRSTESKESEFIAEELSNDEKMNEDKAANIKRQHNKFQEMTEERREMKEIPPFLPRYFESKSAQPFCKENPLQRPTEEVIRRMHQRIERAKLSPDMAGSLKGSQNQGSQEGDALDDKNNPIVVLEPDELKQGSAFLGSKKTQSNSINQEKSQEREALPVGEQGPLPSLYLQEKIYLYNKDQEHLLKAEEHHIVKTKDFNVYGRLRDDKPYVKSIQKSKVPNELNEKFITTECITDRRVKISSMAPRFYMNAPSVEDVRKQGQHQMILSAINKKQTFAELINQANSMVTGVLHDSLKRSLNIMPSFIEFGSLRAGSINEVTITVKNEDQVAHRITVKPVKDKRIFIRQEEYGIIAPGMVKKICIQIRVDEDEPTPTDIKETIQILSKHDIFKIPLTAKLLSFEAFQLENRQNLEATGKPIQNSRVRERLNRAMADSRQSQRSDGPELLTKKPRDHSNREDDSIGAASGEKGSNQYQSRSMNSNR